MRLVVETEQTAEKALLVEKGKSPLMRALKKKLKEYNMHVSETSALPYSFKDVDYMFVALDEYTQGELQQLFHAKTRILIITSHEKVFKEFTHLIEQNKEHPLRIVAVSKDETNPDILERILWFMLSQSSEVSLNMSPLLPETHRPGKTHHARLKFTMTRRRLIVAGTLALILLHTFFLLPLAGALYFTYNAATSLRDQRIPSTESSLKKARVLFTFAEGGYVLAKPGLQFLFLSVQPENLMSLERDSLSFIDTTIKASSNTRAIAHLLLNTHKDVRQVQETRSRIQDLEEQVALLEKSSQSIHDRLVYTIGPLAKIRNSFEKIAAYLRTGSQLIGHMDSILADNTQKTYIFFFYNNMEIRPGGGFIGSFARVTFADYTLKNFEVYDVYDADGQLKTHVRPPAPIRDILDQPHWFLRDSNFNPDFEQNVETARFFLEKELGINDFDGAVAITTTALTYMLDAFGEVYVPDFNETITAENFYLKAQTQTETDFFPGSQQKKSFLSTVGRTLLLKMEDADPALFGIAIKRALDEKHIVIYTKDAAVQADIERLGWSGKVLNPQCITSTSHCIVNHILPVDANLGVNKANYFVHTSMHLKTVFDPSGRIDNELSFAFTNNSPPKVFPGGVYKNYFQVYIPHNARITSVRVNDAEQPYDQSRTGFFTIIGTLLTIEPKETAVITLNYTLHEKMLSGANAYQMVFQKQIGSFNHDFSLEVVFPNGVLITDQNFKSVAKNNSVLYNSSLSANKIFVIEFVKE
jgi:hypothetical protein